MMRPFSEAGKRVAVVTGASAVLASGVFLKTYPRWRSWCLSWGASEHEVASALPGDELMAHPDVVSTRAISVSAPPNSIWPWLVQLGPGRGDVYTYDWIENLLGLNIHSADQILPEFQGLAAGDAQTLGNKGPVMRVAIKESNQCLVLRSDDGNWVWAFVLMPDGDLTRLISRNRIATPDASRLSRLLTTYVMEPGSLIMERKMLIGIKQRAEFLHETGPSECVQASEL